MIETKSAGAELLAAASLSVFSVIKFRIISTAKQWRKGFPGHCTGFRSSNAWRRHEYLPVVDGKLPVGSCFNQFRMRPLVDKQLKQNDVHIELTRWRVVGPTD